LLGAGDTTITVESRGEEEPLVVTADGVWEPQNRRVEIRVEP
jgi:outer membrane protein OmpA-like peptidoglycan-associated protein